MSRFLSFLLIAGGVLSVNPHPGYGFQTGIPDSSSVQLAPETTHRGLTPETIAKWLDEISVDPTVDENSLAAIRELYDRASEFLESSKSAIQDQNKYQQQASQAQSLLESIREKLKNPNDNQSAPDLSDFSEAQLQGLLRQTTADLSQAREVTQTAATEMARRQTRIVELPGLISNAEKRLEEVNAQLETQPTEGKPKALAQARTTRLTAEKRYLVAQIAAYKSEQDAYTLTSDLPPLQEQLAAQKVGQLELAAIAINKRIAMLRESEIQKRIRKARESLTSVSSMLKPIAETNLEIANELEVVSKRIAVVKRKRQRIGEHRSELNEQFETTRFRVEAIGLSDALGIMLRQNKYDLLRLRNQFPVDPNLESEVSQIRAAAFQSEDRAEALSDLPGLSHTYIARLQLSEPQRSEIANETQSLFQQQKESCVRLLELQNDLFNAIFGLLTEQKQFSNLCYEYSDYIDEHVLWIRSAPLLGTTDIHNKRSDLTNLTEAAREWILPVRWQTVANSIIKGVRNRLSMVLIFASGLLLILVSFPRLKSNIRLSSERTAKRSCRSFSPTATTVLETILLAFLWPGVIMTTGWLIKSDFSSSGFAAALGAALINVGLMLFPLEFLRQICRPHGLAEGHFDWPENARKCVRQNILWLICLGVPLLCVVVTMEHWGVERWNNSLGRVASLLLLILATVFIFRVFRPSGPLFHGAGNRDSRFFKLRYIRFSIFLIGHLTLIGLAVSGYYYTTYQLGINLLQSIALAIGVIAIYATALRFLLVRRRRLRYEQLIAQRQEQAKQRELIQKANPESTVSTASSVSIQIAESLDIELRKEIGTDINSVSRQAKELTNVIFVAIVLVGLWQIWQDVLPATKMLDNWELWKVGIGSKGELDSVSLRDLLFSVGFFLLTFFGVRNIPGMLELLLLNQLPLDSGSRYAITTICRYVITVAGVILALNFIKIPWSNYSWLVAAISVGLGFGLQEIVANFASGLIILLERPVRVGDVITIDNTTGIVSRIQMRATTITNWDNQELVVPNKDLVTGRLMNWTLTSVINRVALKVGVAYGTDVSLVKKIIEDVANQNPDVLKEPAPLVSLDEFGDSSLNFKLRCCITALEKRIPITHELNMAINREFAKAGIQIPFPQRDLHIISQPDG